MSQIRPRTHLCKNKGETVIRSAEVADAAELLDIAREVMAERETALTEWEEFNRSVAEQEQWIQDALNHPADIILVAEIAGKEAAGNLVGILNFAVGRKRKIAHAGEFGMSVLSAWRDLGIGRALLSALIEWATEQATIEKTDLTVFASNRRAIHLYESAGFREEGRRKQAVKFADGHYDDLIHMGKFVKDI